MLDGVYGESRLGTKMHNAVMHRVDHLDQRPSMQQLVNEVKVQRDPEQRKQKQKQKHHKNTTEWFLISR